MTDIEELQRMLKEMERKFRHAVGSWTMEVEGLQTDNARLVALFKEAPHKYGCNTYNHLYKDEGVERLLCTCWKRKALDRLFNGAKD